MRFRPIVSWTLILAAALSAIPLLAQTAPKVTTPKEALGFNIGDDYMVANYTQLEAYWKKLASESDRMKLVSIGKTEEGRDQWMAIVSSPENIKNLDKYKQISRRLALAEGVSEEIAVARIDEIYKLRIDSIGEHPLEQVVAGGARAAVAGDFVTAQHQPLHRPRHGIGHAAAARYRSSATSSKVRRFPSARTSRKKLA